MFMWNTAFLIQSFSPALHVLKPYGGGGDFLFLPSECILIKQLWIWATMTLLSVACHNLDLYDKQSNYTPLAASGATVAQGRPQAQLSPATLAPHNSGLLMNSLEGTWCCCLPMWTSEWAWWAWMVPLWGSERVMTQEAVKCNCTALTTETKIRLFDWN